MEIPTLLFERRQVNLRKSPRRPTDETVILTDERRVPLAVVADMTERREGAQITRIDVRRDRHWTVTVEPNVDARLASGQAVVDDQRAGWLDYFQGRHPAVEAGFEGQVASSAETSDSIGRGLIIGLVGIFLIMSFHSATT